MMQRPVQSMADKWHALPSELKQKIGQNVAKQSPKNAAAYIAATRQTRNAMAGQVDPDFAPYSYRVVRLVYQLAREWPQHGHISLRILFDNAGTSAVERSWSQPISYDPHPHDLGDGNSWIQPVAFNMTKWEGGDERYLRCGAVRIYMTWTDSDLVFDPQVARWRLDRGSDTLVWDAEGEPQLRPSAKVVSLAKRLLRTLEQEPLWPALLAEVRKEAAQRLEYDTMLAAMDAGGGGGAAARAQTQPRGHRHRHTNGRMYAVRTGPRGGRYIVVGGRAVRLPRQ